MERPEAVDDEQPCCAQDVLGLDLRVVADGLQAAGWDVLVDHAGEELAARLEPSLAGGVWSLVVDRSGRWRCTLTRRSAALAARQVQIDERSYALLRTEQRMVTTAGRLATAGDLPMILGDLQALALAEGMA